MLSSRTKQINAYGKRGRRIVDANSDLTASSSGAASSGIISIFDDLPPPPQFRSIASKMKKRENMVPPVKVVGLQKKKRLSPVLSPIHKKHIPRVAQIKAEELPNPKAAVSKAKACPSDHAELSVGLGPPASTRAPLSPVVFNLPASPQISHKLPAMETKATAKTKKSFAPFVDVNITVLDDNGRTIRTERRVSQPKGHMASPPSKRSKAPVKYRPKVTSPIVDSESDADYVPRVGKTKLRRKKTIVLSDESQSEDDMPLEVEQSPLRKAKASARPAKPEAKPIKRTRSIVEVVIPPAPYKLPSLPLPTKTPSPPPLPDDYAGLQDSPSPPPTPRPTTFQPSTQQYHLIPSPPLKPRQLTPIKGMRKRFFEPPSPPSPTTPTDFDLSIDFSDLSLDAAAQASSLQQDFEAPEYLLPLLEECNQDTCGPHNFSAFIESFPYDPILQSARERTGSAMQFRKIGEASYSEVFGIGDVVLKVIPIRDESKTASSTEEDDGPAPSDAKDVRKEIIVTRAMGEVYDGFVKLLKTYVVKGKYPERLLQLWDEYNDRKGSESVRPDTFKVSQIYAIIVLPNGGPDLEAYTFHNAGKMGWRQACSLFWQVAKALAHAEHLVSFEHRDLHWGQILVKDLPMHTNALKPLNMMNINQKPKPKVRPWMDSTSHGVQATIIDLGLSRMDAGDGGRGARVHWTPFDEEVFMGEGDYQFDVYRMMRDLTGGTWDKFYPMTNVMWLHYLLQKLLYSKGLKPPAIPRKTKTSSESSLPSTPESAFTEKDCYDCLLDLEEWLGKCVAGIVPSTRAPTVRGKGRGKTQPRIQPTISQGPARAGEVVAYGAKRGWIEATRLY